MKPILPSAEFSLRRRSRGFTLMELLVVITIIGILAAMVFPVANGVLKKARTTQAKSDALQVRQAIETYFTEYRKYPVRGTGGSARDITIKTDRTLMDVLLGSTGETGPGGLNTRQITFYAGKKAKGNPPKAGVDLDASGGGELYDPWGSNFSVVIDSNRNDRVADPSEGGAETIPQGVIVWSFGPDTTDASGKEDDIASW